MKYRTYYLHNYWKKKFIVPCYLYNTSYSGRQAWRQWRYGLLATKVGTNPLSSRVLGILRNYKSTRYDQIRTRYTWYVPGTASTWYYLVRYLVLVP